jgi:CheY-like chemotaxis protein
VALDLLVTDVGLPGMNGRQLADVARVSQPNLPVLLITGYAGRALDDTEMPHGWS